MTNLTELRERLDKLTAQAEADEDVAGELRMLAYDMEQASASAPTDDDARSLLDGASEARGYADRIDRWRENSRRRKLSEEE